MSTLSPNSVHSGNEKSSTTGTHIFFFPLTLEKKEKEERKSGGVAGALYSSWTKYKPTD